MGVGYCGQNGMGGALGWDTRQGMDGIPDTWWGFNHVVGYQTWMGSQTGMVRYQIGMVGYQTGMVGYQTGGGIPDAGGGIPDGGNGIPNAGGALDMG